MPRIKHPNWYFESHIFKDCAPNFMVENISTTVFSLFLRRITHSVWKLYIESMSELKCTMCYVLMYTLIAVYLKLPRILKYISANPSLHLTYSMIPYYYKIMWQHEPSLHP